MCGYEHVAFALDMSGTKLSARVILIQVNSSGVPSPAYFKIFHKERADFMGIVAK